MREFYNHTDIENKTIKNVKEIDLYSVFCPATIWLQVESLSNQDFKKNFKFVSYFTNSKKSDKEPCKCHYCVEADKHVLNNFNEIIIKIISLIIKDPFISEDASLQKYINCRREKSWSTLDSKFFASMEELFKYILNVEKGSSFVIYFHEILDASTNEFSFLGFKESFFHTKYCIENDEEIHKKLTIVMQALNKFD